MVASSGIEVGVHFPNFIVVDGALLVLEEGDFPLARRVVAPIRGEEFFPSFLDGLYAKDEQTLARLVRLEVEGASGRWQRLEMENDIEFAVLPRWV